MSQKFPDVVFLIYQDIILYLSKGISSFVRSVFGLTVLPHDILLQVVQVKREEKAAVKIQAGYRGFQDRQKVKSIK